MGLDERNRKLTCECGEIVSNVGMKAVSVECWRCVAVKVAPQEQRLLKVPTGFPPGWKFMTEFVHEDGRVFQRGIENEKLKGKRKATDLEMLKKKRKQKAEEKKKQKMMGKSDEKLIKEFNRKKKGKQKAINRKKRQIKRLSK